MRLRATRASLLALGTAILIGSPAILAAWPWGLLILVVPALIAWYVVRTKTEITPTSVVVQGPAYRRVIARTDVSGLAVTAKKGVLLLRTDGSSILLPVARPRDLPLLRLALFGPATPS